MILPDGSRHGRWACEGNGSVDDSPNGLDCKWDKSMLDSGGIFGNGIDDTIFIHRWDNGAI